MGAEELTPNTFPNSEPLNGCDLITAKLPPAPNDDVRPKAPKRRQPPPNLRSAAQQSPASADTKMEDPQEFFMDRTFSHEATKDTYHPLARIKKTTYQMNWYGFNRYDDTFESIQRGLLSKVVSNYKLIKHSLLEDINDAKTGCRS